jgi:tungstate transport system ATP-binding protein
MLSVRDLTHRYQGRTVLEVPALELPAGTVTALVGPNGSGKSTLLRLLAFVERPAGGTVSLDGRAVRSRQDRGAARRQVTLVEQHPLLFDMTVLENLRYALRLHGDGKNLGQQGRARAMEALERVGVVDLAEREARRLSGGETQRVALARALLLRPRVLLMDEPLSAADRSARGALLSVLDAQRDAGVTICLSSHQLEDAYRWSDRLLALSGGTLSPVTPENLFRTVLPPGSGAKVVRAGPLEMVVVTDRSGPATLAVPADDIVVSRAPLRTSVRNQFEGRVIAVSDDGRGHVRLTADVGVELVARITPSALAELGLTVGSAVVFGIKAMAVRVF